MSSGALSEALGHLSAEARAEAKAEAQAKAEAKAEAKTEASAEANAEAVQARISAYSDEVGTEPGEIGARRATGEDALGLEEAVDEEEDLKALLAEHVYEPTSKAGVASV